ncbi:MAG TPA: DNA translocase FtsK 4TM domain-containing protein [Actinomycetota bacterium]|nr:DNA translocase FtsK 4TM domain-containing protein [Actinomycetota bacterium]
MATSTRRRTGTPSRRKPASRRAPSKARRPAPRRKPAARRRGKKPNVVLQGARWVGVHIKTAPIEAWGAVAALAGIAAAVGVFARGAGPYGGLVRYLGTLMFGRLVIAVPLLVIALAVFLLVPRLRSHGVRILVGSTVTTLALTAMVHLARGNRPVSTPLDRLRRMGGIFGALLARPLSGLIGEFATWVVALVVMGLGVLIVTRTPLSRVGQWIRTGVVASVHFVKAFLAHDDSEDEAEEDDYEYDDEDVEDGYEEEAAAPYPVAAAAEHDVEDPPQDGTAAAGKPKQLAMSVGSGKSYRLPPVDLLSRGDEREISTRSIEDMTRLIESTMEQFQVDASVTGYTAGPTVTRFEIELGSGVKVNRVLSLSNEMKYALASGELRFLAPIPGRSAIGIEVPNRTRQLVTLGDVLRSKEATRDKHPLAVALGQDISGETVMANLTEMPHVLIAGATNSGKSSCINSMITSVLMRARPDQVRMILIDPKRVELSHFSGVPHLLTPVVTIPKKAASALGWVVREMEMRYETLAHSGMRNLEFYNDAAARGAVVKRSDDDDEPKPLPYILVVVDELSDLMMVAPRDVEAAICRIAQMARAVGIHLVVATQRPSVDVVTGVIKANIPSRLAFSVASQQDSRVILDQGGADKLIGHGDMLFLHANSSKARRIQGSWVNEKEIAAVVGHCRRQGDPDYFEGVTAEDNVASGPSGSAGGGGDDELLQEALELVVRSQLGSTSMLQRKLQVGFARAGRLMDLLEQRGVVGPSVGSKPRDVLMTAEELEDSLARDPA